MNETDQLEQEFLGKGGDEYKDWNALPPGFAEQLPALRADPNLADREREIHVNTTRRLLGQLDSADNLVVKRQKSMVIRSELNALKLLDSIVR